MASRMAESLEWKQARQWLIDGGVIPPVHPATKPGADLVDFARCLRDGVYLCLTLNRLKQNCVQYNARPYMQVSYVRNINAFLTACHHEFGIPEEQLFEEGDLYDVADFQKVIRLLSHLSRSPQALSLGLTPFPGDMPEEDNTLAEESIYANLEDIEWSAEPIDVEEMERIYDVVPMEDDEDPYGDESIYAAVVTYQPMPPAVSATYDEKKKHVIMEMFETEKSFVKVLELIAETYHAAMSPHLPPEDSELLFYLPRQLLGPHRKLLNGFTQCSQNLALDVAQHFLNEQSGLLQYGTYAATMPSAIKKAKQLQESKEMGKVMQETLSRSSQRFPLSDLLSVPMQRILKYPLLIMELVKCAEKAEKKAGPRNSVAANWNNLNTVLETLQDIAKYVNETKRDFECQRAISEIEQSIVEWKGQNQLGRYHLDGELKVKSDDERESKKKWFFLFDKSLIVCKKKLGLGLGALRYNMRDVIATQSIVLGDLPNQHLTKTKLVYPFRVSVPSGSCATGPQSMICYANSEEHKKQWMLAFRNAMCAAKPPGSQDGNHDFELETFDRPSQCSFCKKLLWGTYFQGYACFKCKMSCHRDCLKQVDPCMSSPTQEGKKPPPIQTFPPSKRQTIVKPPGEPSIPRQGSIYIAREKYENPLRGSAYGALMLAKGEEVEVISALDADWWEVISLWTGNRGRVPPSYLKKKEDNPIGRPRSPDGEGLRNQPWYVGRMSRLASEQLLHHSADGVFLIRESDQRHGGFAVALRWKQMPRHIKIQKNPTNQRLFVSDAKDFHSVNELVEHYRHVSLGASFPGVDTPLLYPYWDVASKEVASSAGSIGLSRRTTAEPSRRPTSTSAITSSRHSPDQIHRASLPMMVENNSVLRRTSSGAGPLTPPTPPKIPISNGDPSHNAHSYCEAVYSFKAEYPGELSLQRHCRIRILAKETDRQDWWFGECNGKTGRFPANYVKELH